MDKSINVPISSQIPLNSDAQETFSLNFLADVVVSTAEHKVTYVIKHLVNEVYLMKESFYFVLVKLCRFWLMRIS